MKEHVVRSRGLASVGFILYFAWGCDVEDAEPKYDAFESPESAVSKQVGVTTEPRASLPKTHQVTVNHDLEFDLTDPTKLQVRTPRGKEAWVLAGARALVERAGGPADDLDAVLQAQRLMAAIAAADAVLEVKVAEVSAPLEPATVRPRHEVVFSTERALHGVPGGLRWQVILEAGASCGPPLPELGSSWLALVRVRGQHVDLTMDNPLRSLANGLLEDPGPLRFGPSEIAFAAEAAQKEVMQ